MSKITEQQLNNYGKSVIDSILGYTKMDIEPIFEMYILPIYLVSSSTPEEKSKWKIINRETEEEYTHERAILDFKNIKLND